MSPHPAPPAEPSTGEEPHEGGADAGADRDGRGGGTAPPIPLADATRDRWAARLAAPTYDRGATRVGVVHVGVGAFHRAHQAEHHDRLLAAGHAEWAICGVGALDHDAAAIDDLRAQDGLYSLIERGGDGDERARVLGAITELAHAPREREAVLRRLAAPSTRIVSLTITEGGYGEDADPAAFALLAEGLERRRATDAGPVTVMSCDNLTGNGELARAALLRAAAAHGGGLDDWMAEHVAFPSSAVDRITPAPSGADRAHIAGRYGVADQRPVVCEPWTWWVLEDRFAAGRPPYEDAGVLMVDDVAPYEALKLRVLNAGHQALAYFGTLLGHAHVHDAARDPALRSFVLGYMTDEAAPTLPSVPGVDVPDYARSVLDRFANPTLRDPLARLTAESTDRVPAFLLPVAREQAARGGPVHRVAAVVAGWAHWAAGAHEAGTPVVDRRADELVALARRERERPGAFLEAHDLLGDLAAHPPFADAVARTLRSLREHGARATVDALPTQEAP